MADNSGMIKIALFAGAGYLAWQQGWFSKIGAQLGLTKAAAATPTTPAASTASPAVVSKGPVATSTLDAVFTNLVNLSAHDPDVMAHVAGPDTYNVYLLQAYPAAGPIPSPEDLFPDFVRTPGVGMPIAHYWSVMAPWLQANKGFAGLGVYGLGCCGTYGTLRSLGYAQRGRW